MSEVTQFIRRAAEKTGFSRDVFDDSKLPTYTPNITILPCFGDLRSIFALSSLVLKPFMETFKGKQYFILASWPGLQGLFPYVDEYWSIASKDKLQRFYEDAQGFENKHNLQMVYIQNLNNFFPDLVMPNEMEKFYDRGLSSDYWKEFKSARLTYPSIPSSSILGAEFSRQLSNRSGYKVFVYPAVHTFKWSMNQSYHIRPDREFWVALVERLLADGYAPVLYNSPLTHDLSKDFTQDCMYVTEPDLLKVLSVMRATGCVLDVFSGISRLALMARCPALVVDERAKFAALKEYELDDLCGQGVPLQYIFSFSTIIDGGTKKAWDANILNVIMQKLEAFLPTLDRDDWPSAKAVDEVVDYGLVRKRKIKRLGTRFIKIPRD
tara:strand:- start:7148 stop:8287 length:1140 start_codon:yes stop_codon:yes gene_type:complete